jgi:myosin heavy subunit
LESLLVIEGLLFSALGFLAATGLAMAIAPALWRRAEHLERRRIEAALPLTREELEGEIDAVRAQAAMAVRRLEVKADDLRKRSAADLVKINVLNDRVRDLEEECAAGAAEIKRGKQERESLDTTLAARDGELREQSAQLAELTHSLAQQMNEVQSLNRLNDELSMTASTLKIDLVARETEVERLNNTISALRTQRREAERLAREATAEKVELENALRLERTRVGDLQGRVERLLRDLSDRDQMLERRERELAQLRGGPVLALPAVTAAPMEAAAGFAEQGEAYASTPQEAALGDAEADELQRRIDKLAETWSKRRSRKGDKARQDDDALREEISAIAARMVHVVAEREGPNSPIVQALVEPLRDLPGMDSATRPESLAYRVQKLRTAS